jgi:hypothetical protein
MRSKNGYGASMPFRFQTSASSSRPTLISAYGIHSDNGMFGEITTVLPGDSINEEAFRLYQGFK